jgi:hypothetical protein
MNNTAWEREFWTTSRDLRRFVTGVIETLDYTINSNSLAETIAETGSGSNGLDGGLAVECSYFKITQCNISRSLYNKREDGQAAFK